MSNLLRTTVSETGLTAMIRRLATECHPLQFIREFTQNSLEAIQRTGKPGTLLIDVNWDYFDLGITPGFKISFTDTGDGMFGNEMEQHINQLASTGAENVYENYGMGAKISAITRNEYGITYDSWKNGVGNQIHYRFDPDDQFYGLDRFVHEDGSVHYHNVIENAIMPHLIKEHSNGQHGTRVTLWGMSPDQDTMAIPKGAQGTREAWIYSAVNSRYFEIPEGVEIKIRIGYDRDRDDTKHNHLLSAKGQKATLDKYKVHAGIVNLSDANVHWWILQSDRSGHGRDDVAGHTAVLNQNELFNRTRSRTRAADFGISFGAADVVLYIEPNGDYVQNTARTLLIKRDGTELPFEKWADEFRENMPKELSEFIAAKMNETTSSSHDDSIRGRLKALQKFYKLTRYRITKRGSIEVDADSTVESRTGRSGGGGSGGGGKGGRGGNPGSAVEMLAVLRKAGGDKATEVTPDPFPTFRWVTLRDGTREPDEMEDRAATFLEKGNLIKANKDFQGFQDLISHYLDSYKQMPGAAEQIVDIVTEQFEQLLIETVTGALSFKGRPNWNPEDFRVAVSDEALTSAVMTRYFIMREINRVIRGRLGKPDEAAA